MSDIWMIVLKRVTQILFLIDIHVSDRVYFYVHTQRQVVCADRFKIHFCIVTSELNINHRWLIEHIKFAVIRKFIA